MLIIIGFIKILIITGIWSDVDLPCSIAIFRYTFLLESAMSSLPDRPVKVEK